MIHELKILPQYFESVSSGAKTAELRVNDREFGVDDVLVLREYRRGYTGREMRVVVTHILVDFEGLSPGWVMLSFRRGEG